CLVAVLDRVEPKELGHPIVYRPAERANIDPAVTALERVVGLEPRRTVSGMSIKGAFAGVEGQRVAIGLCDRFVLREVDHLAAPAFLYFPERHHGRRPSGQCGQVVASVGFGPLRWSGGVTGEVHHSAIRLRYRVVAGAAEIVVLAVLPISA